MENEIKKNRGRPPSQNNNTNNNTIVSAKKEIKKEKVNKTSARVDHDVVKSSTNTTTCGYINNDMLPREPWYCVFDLSFWDFVDVILNIKLTDAQKIVFKLCFLEEKLNYDEIEIAKTLLNYNDAEIEALQKVYFDNKINNELNNQQRKYNKIAGLRLGRGSGKSTMVCIWAIWRLFTFCDVCNKYGNIEVSDIPVFALFSRTREQSDHTYMIACNLIENIKKINKDDDGNIIKLKKDLLSRLEILNNEIIFKNKLENHYYTNKIMIKTGDARNARGYTVIDVLIEEAEIIDKKEKRGNEGDDAVSITNAAAARMRPSSCIYYISTPDAGFSEAKTHFHNYFGKYNESVNNNKIAARASTYVMRPDLIDDLSINTKFLSQTIINREYHCLDDFSDFGMIYSANQIEKCKYPNNISFENLLQYYKLEKTILGIDIGTEHDSTGAVILCKLSKYQVTKEIEYKYVVRDTLLITAYDFQNNSQFGRSINQLVDYILQWGNKYNFQYISSDQFNSLNIIDGARKLNKTYYKSFNLQNDIYELLLNMIDNDLFKIINPSRTYQEVLINDLKNIKTEVINGKRKIELQRNKYGHSDQVAALIAAINCLNNYSKITNYFSNIKLETKNILPSRNSAFCK